MSKITKLLENYTKHISVPWRSVAPDQRVMFCVYDPSEERQLRFNTALFMIETQKKDHQWFEFDMTSLFAEWLTSQKYAKKYFANPTYISSILDEFPKFIQLKFDESIQNLCDPSNTVVAIVGAGSIFGIAKVKDVISLLAPMVQGRLLVFFPGSYVENNYRLLDAYDGWNYLAIPILSE